MFKDAVKEYMEKGIATDCGILSTPYGSIAIGEKKDVLTCIAMVLRELRLKGLIDSDDLKLIIKAVMLSEEDLEEESRERKETAKKSLDDIQDIIERIEKLIEE